MLKIKVKVGKVTNLSDARYCAGMGVDLLGFPLGPHDGIDPKKFKEITDWVSGPAFILEWEGDEIPENFEDIIRSYNVQYVQIGVQHLEKIKDLPVRLVVSLPVSEWSIMRPKLTACRNMIDYLVLTKTEHGKIDSDLLERISKEFMVLLGEGFLDATPDELITFPVAGIAMERFPESRPGYQDYSRLAEMLEQLDIDNQVH